MISEKKEDIDRIKKDFLKIKKDNKLSKSEIDDLMSDLTQLLGIYAIDKEKELAELIEEIIDFGQNNNLSLGGAEIEFENIKKR